MAELCQGNLAFGIWKLWEFCLKKQSTRRYCNGKALHSPSHPTSPASRRCIVMAELCQGNLAFGIQKLWEFLFLKNQPGDAASFKI